MGDKHTKTSIYFFKGTDGERGKRDVWIACKLSTVKSTFVKSFTDAQYPAMKLINKYVQLSQEFHI